MINHATVNWEGSSKSGTGYIHSGRGVYNLDYTYTGRVGETRTTNPEELVAAAHAACFAMALRFGLDQANIEVGQLEVRCEVMGPEIQIKHAHLIATIVAKDNHQLIREIAERAKENCPISQILNYPVTVETQFIKNSNMSSNYS